MDLSVQIYIFSLLYAVPLVCTEHQVIRTELRRAVGIKAFDSQL